MLQRESRQLLGAEIGQLHPDGAPVGLVFLPNDQTSHHGAIDQTDDSVVGHQQRVAKVRDGRPLPVWVPANGQQQLMLRCRQTDPDRLILAPFQKAPDPRSKREQSLEFGV